MRMKEFASSHSAFGVNFRLCADRAELLDAMQGAVPLGTERAESDDASASYALRGTAEEGYRLVSPEGETASADLRAALERLRMDLMVHVANYAAGRVFVHAGVVSWQGRAAIFPGTSFAGKTTLVAELVRAGATYFSDEYAVLDHLGFVHPYARDLQMRRPGSREQTSLPARSLGGVAGQDPVPVAQVLFANYVPGGRWRPQPVSAGMAILEMVRHAIPVQRTPGVVLSVLAKMMEKACAFRSERGEASEVAHAILRSLG